uniref:Uncharacterized protein n=1 Tax=Triticum urartu TaxID=4572 RepID=A0A8R7Q7Y5_TRIUA
SAARLRAGHFWPRPPGSCRCAACAWYKDCRPAPADQALTPDAEERRTWQLRVRRVRRRSIGCGRRCATCRRRPECSSAWSTSTGTSTAVPPTSSTSSRQGKRKPGANHCQYKRLLGVARLLSQMLLDVVSVYNKVTDLTDKKQSVKISIGKVQACFASTLLLCNP